MAPPHRMVILYGYGGTSDVGRHAIQVALDEHKDVSVVVLTQHPELLSETNWHCGCQPEHTLDLERIEKLVKVDTWDDDSLTHHFAKADSVVMCVGNRQPGLFDKKIQQAWVAADAAALVLKAMKENQVKRLVVMSSVGIEEDWPPVEWHWGGKIMSFLFLTLARGAYDDLCKLEKQVRSSEKAIDYLIVRPVGISDDAVPRNSWKLLKETNKDTNLGVNMAKMDVARFMVQEALNPTEHCEAVTIGPGDDEETKETGTENK